MFVYFFCIFDSQRKYIKHVHPALHFTAQGYSFMLSIFTVLFNSIALYNFPQQLRIYMFYGWLQWGLCETWDLYSIYSHPKAWIISDFGSIGNMANTSHLTFMQHGVKDECLEWGKGINCVEGAKQSLTIRSGKNSWTFQPKNQIALYAWPHLCMLRQETGMKSFRIWHTYSLVGACEVLPVILHILTIFFKALYCLPLAFWEHFAVTCKEPFTIYSRCLSQRWMPHWCCYFRTEMPKCFWEPWTHLTVYCMSDFVSIH